jgi:hypothetical protein
MVIYHGSSFTINLFFTILTTIKIDVLLRDHRPEWMDVLWQSPCMYVSCMNVITRLSRFVNSGTWSLGGVDSQSLWYWCTLFVNRFVLNRISGNPG